MHMAQDLMFGLCSRFFEVDGCLLGCGNIQDCSHSTKPSIVQSSLG